MTRNEVMLKAMAKEITWIQAASICGISDRQMRRMKQRFQERGYDGLVDGRSGKPRRKRIAVAKIEEILKLRRERYADFSIRHCWEKVTEKHQIEIGYTWLKLILQGAGLAEKSPGRGRYRRKRERRSLRGMMVHMDASTHAWIEGKPMQDLVVALDDADGRILFAQFVAQEGTAATFVALKSILTTYGRFCELYTDRGSHFCLTSRAGEAPTTEHQGQVSRALKVLGIRQILAWSPEARGRSERCFKTIQGRLPQELREAGIGDYAAANQYLVGHFVPDFNRRFTVEPAQAGSAFVPIVGVDLDLLLSSQFTRTVGNDSCVRLGGVSLQLPRTAQRAHYVRCEVIAHQFPEGTLGVSYQGRLLARYSADGQLIEGGTDHRRAQRASMPRLPMSSNSATSRVATTPARHPGAVHSQKSRSATSGPAQLPAKTSIAGPPKRTRRGETDPVALRAPSSVSPRRKKAQRT